MKDTIDRSIGFQQARLFDRRLLIASVLLKAEDRRRPRFDRRKRTKSEAFDLPVSSAPQELDSAPASEKILIEQCRLGYLLQSLKQIQTELAVANERYQLLYDSSSTSCATVSADGSFIDLNPNCAGLLKTNREQAIGQLFARYLDLQDHDAFNACLQNSQLGNSQQGIVLTLVSAHGEGIQAHLHCHHVPVQNQTELVLLVINEIPRQKIVHASVPLLDSSNAAQEIEQNVAPLVQKLEYQLHQKDAELEQIKTDLREMNALLKALVHHQDAENNGFKHALAQEIQQEIVPFLTQLKKGSQAGRQETLIRILEANVQHLFASSGRKNCLARAYQELTPKEIQVATMVRQGLSTKLIAATLSTSSETINVHRKNIRRKLGLDNQPVNLRSFLASYG